MEKTMFIQCVVCCVVLVIPHTHAVYDNTVGSSQHYIRHEKHKQETRHYNRTNSFECMAQVSKKWISEEPLPCGKTPHVKNSSCFLCVNQCKSEEEIQTYLTQPNNITHPIRCPTKRVTKECCLLSNMKNMGMVPSAKGQYNCYKEAVHRRHNKSVYEPLKNCLYGQKGENCEEPCTQPVNCSCYLNIHFQKMPECNEEKQDESWTMCYMDVTRSDKKYTCVCERSKDLKQMENCLSPTADEITDTDINGSSNFKKRNNLLVLIAVSYACAIMSRQAY